MPIITITGTPGSGKSTLARALAEQLGYRYYSIGNMRRELARERGITLAELNRRSETGEEDNDTHFEQYQQRLGETEDNFVIEGRLGYLFIPESIKLFVDADEQVRARRMLERIGTAEPIVSLEDARTKNRARMESDRKRYQKYYHIDPGKLVHFDLVLDTTATATEELVATVLRRFPTLMQRKP
jgi:CMP/dCMP kinase